MLSKVLNVLKYLVLLGIALTLLHISFKDIDFNNFFEGLKKADYTWVMLSLLISVLSHLSRAYRWKMLLKPLGYNPSLPNLFHAVMAGYFANLALPRMGEVTRCALLKKTDKIPVEQAIGTVILERAIDLLCLIVIIVATVFIELFSSHGFITNYMKDNMHQSVEKFRGLIWIIVILSLIGIGIAYFLFTKRNMVNGPKWLQKIMDFLKGLYQGLLSISKLENKSAFLLHTVLIWIGYYLMTYVVFFSLESTAHLTVGNGLTVLVIGSLAMTAPVQGGIGTYHFLVSRSLEFFNINLDDGMLFATLMHSSQVILIMVFGLIGLLVLVLKKREITHTAT